MTDIPVIFSGPMVCALLDGRKTMTRRMASRDCGATSADAGYGHSARVMKPTSWQRVKAGDLLWVRENVHFAGGGDPGIPIYAANWREDAETRDLDNIPAHPPKWTPSIHMPRWASRLTLEVTATKIERLQDISESDARLEGATPKPALTGYRGLEDGWSMDWRTPHRDHALGSARMAFANYFNALHGAGSWDANPEVVALTFKVHKLNIDEFKIARAA